MALLFEEPLFPMATWHRRPGRVFSPFHNIRSANKTIHRATRGWFVKPAGRHPQVSFVVVVVVVTKNAQSEGSRPRRRRAHPPRARARCREIHVRRSDVLSAWQGWRPLYRDPNAPPGSPVSRHHAIGHDAK